MNFLLNTSEQCIHAVGTDQNKNCSKEHNSLLCFFLEYFWDDSEGSYPGCGNIDLKKWLISEDVDINEESWYFSNKFDVRAAQKIELTDDLKSHDNAVQKAHNLNSRRMQARLAYRLRKILPILIACNNEVDYTTDDGQTILHIFIDKYLKDVELFSNDEIVKVRQLLENLVKIGASFCANDKNGNTPIHIATSCQSNQVLGTIVSILTNVHESDDDKNTILHIVVNNSVDNEGNYKCGYVSFASALVSKGADIHKKNKRGEAPIHLAAGKLHEEMLKFLVDKGSNCCQVTDDDETPLHFLSKSTLKLKDSSRAEKIFDFLVSAGCDIEALNKEGYSSMHYASETGALKIVDKLIKLGANVNCKTNEMLITPLYLSAKSNELAVMKRLVEANAEINARALDATSPLFISTLCGSFESMQFLLDCGAEIYVSDNVVEFSLLHIAAYDPGSMLDDDDDDDTSVNTSENSDNQAREKKNMNKIDAIIGLGFYENDSANCNITPLQLAIIRENIYNVQVLIQNGADVNYQSEKSSYTGLHLAAIQKNFRIAEILLKNGASVDCRGGIEQRTALHFALADYTQWGLGKYPTDLKPYKEKCFIDKYWPKRKTTSKSVCERLVGLLLFNGAEVNVRDTAHVTPLHLACLTTNSNVISKLLDAYAEVNVQDLEGKTPLHNILEDGKNADGLIMLLDCGSDINDEDTSRLILNSKEELKIIVAKHALRLKLASLNIAEIYEPLIHMPVLTQFYNDCLVEAENLKHPSSEKSIDSEKDFDHRYPIFSGICQGRNREFYLRNELLKIARIAWTQLTEIYLPDLCVDKILSNLNYRYLSMFAACSNNNLEKIQTDQKTNFVISS